MPIFVVERKYADLIDLDEARARQVDEYNADHDIKWITSFLSADKKKTYCMYEVDDVEMLRRHAADLGLPFDAITQVDEFAR